MGTVYSPFGEVPYPDENAAYDVPAHLSAIVNLIDDKLTGESFSTSERDSKFYAAPAGFVAKVVNPPGHPTNPDEIVGIYVKTGKAGVTTWYALYEPATTMAEQPLQVVDGYDPRDGVSMPTVFRENEHFAVLNGAVVKSDGTKIVSGAVIAYLPTGFNPYRTAADYPVSEQWASGTAGAAKISIFQGAMSIMYTGPDVAWVGFDGVRFRLL